uniref:Arginine/serine-rich splicing factor RSZ21 transcript IV n=1 Tax=Sorghum bicolor TaxID=4558 RepID=M1H560_SORBI|nr:arginine/serine-rich splicing factor RSZ21 transcript IV [Sorghum bicolor]
MARLYVGNLDPRVTARELEDEFRTFGVLRSVWVARKPPGFAFIDFDDKRDAEDAIRALLLVQELQYVRWMMTHLLVLSCLQRTQVSECQKVNSPGQMLR